MQDLHSDISIEDDVIDLNNKVGGLLRGIRRILDMISLLQYTVVYEWSTS